jgi:hypothetical protein
MWEERWLKIEGDIGVPLIDLKDTTPIPDMPIMHFRRKPGIVGRQERFVQCSAFLMSDKWSFSIKNATTKKDITHKFDIELT